MSAGGLLAGTHTLLVGVEDEPTGGLRLYLGHRSRGLYTVITDAVAIEEVRRAWGSGGHGGHHITLPIPPPECVYSDREGKG